MFADRNVFAVGRPNIFAVGRPLLQAGALALLLPTLAMAAPQGGVVTAGSGSISASGNTTTIRQNSQHLSLSWQSFNVARQETVNFNQPDASAIAVNRIHDVNGSRIMGHLNANGQVYLLNPNGILFGQHARVNVGGLVASTLNIPDAELGKRLQTFSGAGAGEIVNNGAIHADNGYVALLGNRVRNNGVITAKLGTVAMGGGSQVTLTFNGNRLLKIQVDKSVLDSLAANHGLIQADGGLVAMSAGARDALLASVVNNDGVIQAQTVQKKNGKIVLLGGMAAGTAKVAGTLDASAPASANPAGGDGGFIETSAAHVKVADGAKVTTKADNGASGTWLIDPAYFLIAPTADGGDITGATLSSSLAAGNVTILSSSGAHSAASSTYSAPAPNNGIGGSGPVNSPTVAINASGDIFVFDPVSWSANTLTLTAAGDIRINAVMSATGTAALALNPATANTTNGTTDAAITASVVGGQVRTGLSGSGFYGRVDMASTASLSINGTPYTIITALGAAGSISGTDLQGINGNLAGHYALGADINAAATSAWNGGAGFLPLGDAATAFTGAFDGLGHVVSNLTINRPNATYIGLFGNATNAAIGNTGISGGSVSGGDNIAFPFVGALAGQLTGVTLHNSFATAAVSSGSLLPEVGGLAGQLSGGFIVDSFATGNVTSSNISATGEVGGLAGLVANNSGIVSSFATGSVTNGSGNTGGLVGSLLSSWIQTGYATGSVTNGSGGSNTGGLVGRLNATSALGLASITYSYAAGSVTSGGGNTGGLVGLVQTANAFSSGEAYIASNNWDTQTTGQTAAIGTIAGSSLATSGNSGLTTAQMQSNPSGLTFDATGANAATAANLASGFAILVPQFRLYAGHGYPALANLLQPLQVTAASGSRVYDATTTSNLGVTYSTTPNANLLGTATVTAAAKNVGNQTLTASGLYSNQQGYDISYATGTLNITPATLSAVTGITAANKVYDATTAATLTTSGAGFSGILGSDVLNVAGATGAFTDKNVGTGKTVNITGITLGGADAGNYTLANNTATTTADITKATISSVTNLGANTKIYDGNATATLNTANAVFNGKLGSDVLNVASATGNFVDRNAGTNKTVNITGITLGGTDAGNYTLASTTVTTTGTIQQKQLGVTGLTANNKVYDATVNATISGTASLTGVVSGDTVTVSGTPTGAFTNKNVGTGKPVNISGLSLTGASAANYVINGVSTSADITPATLTVGGLTANNKVYDGTTSATFTGMATLSGVLGADVVNLAATPTGSFADKNVGNGKTVSLTGGTITGTDAGNYVLATPAPLSANITPATISAVTGITAANKVYDGSAAATLTTTGAGFTGMVAGDALNVASASGAFANKNAGNGKTVNITGITLGGTDAGNYTLTNNTATTTANITPKALTVSGITAANKVYDATTNATVSGTGTLSGVIAGDTVSLAGTASGAFVDKNVGTGKTVNITGLSLTGTSAANYSINGSATATADITPATLTVSGLTAANKVYDGNTNATLNGTAVLSGVFAGDTVLFSTGGFGSSTAQFANKNVGNGKSVTLTSAALTGLDAGNYTLTQPGLTANITPAALTITGLTASNKVYDGNANAPLSGTATLSGVISGDTVALAGTATGAFANKNVGNGKAVTVSGNTLTGLDAGNYTLSQPTGLTANITPKALTLSGITAANKVYDATTNATVSGTGTLSGVLSGDTVTLAGTASGAFVDKNVGTGKTVNITGLSLTGTSAANYSINGSATTTADITPATLTVSGITASNKVYDGTTNATLNGTAVLSGVFAGDTVLFNLGGPGSSTAQFANKNVGTAKSVTLTSAALTGTDAGNYTLTQPGLTANITPAALTITGLTASNKVYDGNANAPLSGTATLSGVISGDTVALAGTATGAFANKNVGNGKAVTVSGNTLTGLDAGNYTLSQPTGLTANITPKALTLSGITAANKVYDATTNATLTSTGTLSGVIAGDTVSLAGTASGAFVDKNVGTGKTVNITGLSLTGLDAANYSISGSATTTADITPATLTVSGLTAANKVYDGTTGATITGTPTLTGLLGADVVSFASPTGRFANKNVGTGKTVTLSGAALTGTDAGNYTLVNPGTLTANITPALINSVTGITAANKVYNGTTHATLNTTGAGFTGILGSDVLRVASATGNFSDKNVGTGKRVNITGLSLGGADAANYRLSSSTATTSADITPATLTYTAKSVHIIQGQPLPVFDGSVSGFAGGDTLANATSGTLTWRSPANGNTPGSFAINGEGLSALNYLFAQAAGNATALTIAPGRLPARAANPVAAVQHIEFAIHGGSGQRIGGLGSGSLGNGGFTGGSNGSSNGGTGNGGSSGGSGNSGTNGNIGSGGGTSTLANHTTTTNFIHTDNLNIDFIGSPRLPNLMNPPHSNPENT